MSREHTVTKHLRHALIATRFARQNLFMRLVGGRISSRLASSMNPQDSRFLIGLTRAFALCRQLLRPGGYLVFTDAVWRKENPPAEIVASFDAEYPDMGRMEDVLRKLQECGLEAIDHFTLPDEAWWDDFYTPMEHRIEALRKPYRGDAKAAAILDELALEPEIHRRYSDYYAYEFFVARKPRA